MEKYIPLLSVAIICMAIQWHGHYLKDEVNIWLDFVPSLILFIALLLITTKS